MRIALFADIHGKILLPFKLCDLYQEKTGNKVDLILQCGDIGAFPSLKNLDKATIRHAKNDRDELGFYDDFTTEKKEIKTYLDKLNLNMICVRGNHEDHEYLNQLEEVAGNSRFPIDIYKRVYVCKSGEIQQFEKGHEILSFVGIGRIGDRKGRAAEQFVQDYERTKINKLRKIKAMFDILISHDKDDQSQRGYGMAEIRMILDNVVFQYHFYGHTGEPFNVELDTNQITQSCKIKELEFTQDGILPPGCMIILEKENDQLNMEVVPLSITNKLTKHNWKY